MKFFIQRPGGARKSFSIKAYTPEGHRVKKYYPLPKYLKTSLDEINSKYKRGDLTLDEAFNDVKGLIQKPVNNNTHNESLFKTYWNTECTARPLVDPKSKEYELRKALRLLGDLNLYTATPTEIQDQIRKTTKSVSELRHTIDNLNQFLKFIGKPNLRKPAPPYKRVRFVTRQDLTEILSGIKDRVLVDMAWVLFGTGCRLSEALALDYYHVNGTVLVDKQLTRSGHLKLPKRGKSGHVMVLPFSVASVKRWVRLSLEMKQEYRDKLRPVLEKHKLSPHDLRHSHAIHLIEKGCTLAEVSMQLRNSVAVCQLHYVGFQHTSGTIDRIKTLLKGR